MIMGCEDCNKLEYLRGKSGVCVNVSGGPLNFTVRLRGNMGWSETLINNGEWGGSGTIQTFCNFDDALDAGILRVKEILNEINFPTNIK